MKSGLILTLLVGTLTACHSGSGSRLLDGPTPPTPAVPPIVQQRADAQAALGAATGPTAKLRVLETTDLHVAMESFDYYKNLPTLDSGLVRAATLIRRSRAEVTNAILIDNGDLLQGNPLGDWFHKDRDPKTDLHTVFKAMNLLGYDAANLGNHDFNYGLDFMEASLTGAKFPYVSANVVKDDGTAETLIQPYVILTRDIVTDAGVHDQIKIGVIGFTPPQIMNWDKTNLAGKVLAPDMVDVAAKLIPKMRADGAELIVAVPHSGINAGPRQGSDENAVYYLAQVPGIDVILCGHSHQVFPSQTYKDVPNADLTKGLLMGLPTVMAGFWGSHVGVVDLALKKTADGWHVLSGTAEAREVKSKVAPTDFEADVRSAIAADHQATLTYLQEVVGATQQPIDSYFSQVAPSLAVQVVADAQTWYAKKLIADGGADTAALQGLPVLSASAPLNAGANPTAYTDVPVGQLTLRNVADMYVYPNTFRVVKVTGAVVREWLEMSAQMFTQIKPNSADEQPLVTGKFPAYNFDQLFGLQYAIDLTQPPRYDRPGKLLDANAHRIVNLTYNGQPVTDAQVFLVATNNYRANGGGQFPGLDGKQVVLDPGRESREVLRDYTIANGGLGLQPATQFWKLMPVQGASNIILESGPGGKTHLGETGGLVTYVGDATDGFSRYKLAWPAPL